MSATPAPDEQTPPTDQDEQDVLLLGGPDDWHHATLRMPAAALHREGAGAMLITAHTPHRDEDTEDIDPRAIYEPDPYPAPVDVWWFRGWFPAATTQDEFPRPPATEHQAADVACDSRGAPLGWTLRGESAPWRVTRHRVHWVYEAAVPGGGDVAVWQLDAQSPGAEGVGWELVHDPGLGGWTVAPLPDRA